MGAVVATAALLAGFGAAILVYGPLGVPFRQIGGSTLNVPPTGVSFGSAQVMEASALGANNTTGGPNLNVTFNYTAQGFVQGPCNHTGVWESNSTAATAANESYTLTNGTTLVCLNAVENGALNATWYGPALNNSYTAGGAVNGSYYTLPSGGKISSCDNASLFQYFNELQANGSYAGQYLPCSTYFEMNNNTDYLTNFNATSENSSSLWSPNQTGYAPGDLLYVVPVFFANTTLNATYEVTISIDGVTPVAQNFYFSDTGNGTSSEVLFSFDMTAAWLMDLSIDANGTAFNSTLMPIYASIGVTSAIVSQCGLASGLPVCPIAAAKV